VHADLVVEEAAQLAGVLQAYVAHDFVFEEDAQTLGFTVHWVQDGLPLVGEVKLGAAANMQGVLPGDQLAECNGVSLEGKDRQQILQLLGARPLWLRMFRL